MNQLRIAIVLQTPKDQHSSVYLTYQSLARELTHRGHQVAIVTPQDFPLARKTAGRWTPLIYPWIVARWMGTHAKNCDLAVFHSYAGWRAVSAARRHNVKTVVAFHGLEPLYHAEIVKEMEAAGGLSWRYRLLQERLMPMFLRRACRYATLITCLNTAERDTLVEMGWTTDNRVAIVGHGVGDRFFSREPRERPPRTLLFVGQWLGMKGVAFLREAFQALARTHPSLRLICAGTLVGKDEVLASFDQDVRARVTVLPRVDQPALADVYKEADLFVFPSSYDGFGLAIVEAMAARLPIVVTPVGVAADALQDGVSALFIPKRDAQAIVRAVERLLQDPVLRQELGDAAQEAARNYRETETVRAWAHTLTSVDRLS
jgi:glycosyltransferase involved in cell wall biosynthesis